VGMDIIDLEQWRLRRFSHHEAPLVSDLASQFDAVRNVRPFSFA
jgi:hypothetical protein